MGEKKVRFKDEVFILVIFCIMEYVFYIKNEINLLVIFGSSVFGIIFLYTIIIHILRRRKNKLVYNSSLRKIDKMTGIEFENYLKLHFEHLGYKVDLTPVSGDYGADLIARKGMTTIIIQAKRYKGKVSLSAVQEVYAAIAYYEGNKGIVVTNSYFTQNAKKLAEKCKIELWDRDLIKKKFQIK